MCGAQGAGRKQVAAVMGIQTARSSTVARPFMRLKPQNIAVQVPLNPADAEVSLLHRISVPAQSVSSATPGRAHVHLSARKCVMLYTFRAVHGSRPESGYSLVHCQYCCQFR
jgi:hypothetical protein